MIGLLDSIEIEHCGSTANMRSVANVIVKDRQTLVVKPFDEEASKRRPSIHLNNLGQIRGSICKAINAAGLNYNARVEGQNIIIQIPKYGSNSRTAH